ncbi:hypothetical protein CBER1_10920 [Cercospora berteroae]|uniref:C3H1-type domain-containing protein n=1 Tax=Cercospora berteroae TaxID=357750 RepID=A0A2S6BY28_9PEZI|nr:hypothetical protein CBER1_10920 [Cercospora berteroae]
MVYYNRGSFSGKRGGPSDPGRSAGNSAPSRPICFYHKRGICKYGRSCTKSHDRDERSLQRDKRVDETLEQLEARAGYNSWRSAIRLPPQENASLDSQSLWDEALNILNGDDRDCKQSLPRDLENEDDYFGRQHIRALLCGRAKDGRYHSFVEVSRSFFFVMTHPALVDCLSVETYVGNLYSFISGTNGTRAVPYFQHVCEIAGRILADPTRKTSVETINSTLVGLLEILSELLQRERRARFNESLPELLDSLENCAETMPQESLVTSSLIISRVGDLRSVVARANTLLSTEGDAGQQHKSTTVVQTSYPRDMIIPGGRHDNDKVDITTMNIFPTLDEIMSDAKEFLPSTDPDQPHFLDNRRERYIDTYFRLLRHDVLGQLKNDIGSFMKTIVRDPKQMKNPMPVFSDSRTYSYSNAFVSYLLLKKSGGLQARISFPQPRSFRKKQRPDKRKWWEESRRLEEGILLSFLWIQESSVHHLFLTVAERNTDPRSDSSLTHNENMATITTKLATQDKQHVELLLKLSCEKVHGVMLEFPHVLPATFTPVLKSLQHMQRLNRMPFQEWILPPRVEQTGNALKIPPPLYARHAGFEFPLDAVLGHGSSAMSLPSMSTDQDLTLMAELETKTGLDRGQCSALIAALTREFALIQGPPGTGKSYVGVKIMQILQSVKARANLGPIIVVCYTNHALDQFLEHLIATGIRKIVRIGGQSRSEALEGHNLRNVTKSESKSRQEGWQVASAYRALEEHENRSGRILGRVHGVRKRPEWRAFQHHLARKHRRICEQFNTVDVDGFNAVGRHPFEIWTSGIKQEDDAITTRAPSARAVDRTTIVEKANRNVQALSYSERQALVGIWTKEIQEDAAAEFFEVVEDAEQSQRQLSNVHEEVNRRVLQSSDVIGITTSGLAKNSSTIRRVRSKVVICEEAGEVMEPHVMSALLPSVEHFIQIGDHQQLRPSINNFLDLSLESDRGKLHQLDRSQFERLSVGEPGRPSIPLAQLNVQRRMRPEISTLIRETIYKRLDDHPSTIQLPNVVGMRKNVFWLDHNNMEDDGGDSMNHHKKSKSNGWELQMVHALVRHVVRQGVYSTSDIAVLTPYTGQLQRLRAAMRQDFEIVLSDRDEEALIKDGFTAQDSIMEEATAEQNSKKKPLEKKQLSELLRIATVDNFQGEEAKIIIISLVRSNKSRRVGFLKTTNRINVLLSRAQHGMYLVGNIDTYSCVPMWQKVIDMLRAQDCAAARRLSEVQPGRWLPGTL